MKIQIFLFCLIYHSSSFAQVQMGADIDGETAGENSGTAVCISSDGLRVAIGAPVNSEQQYASGQVRVYQYDGNAWGQLGSDVNGESALWGLGRYLAFSSSGDRFATSYLVQGMASVRTYDLVAGVWTQVGDDILQGDNSQQGFGQAMSLSADGNRLAIGAPLAVGGLGQTGKASIFQFSGGQWVQLGVDIFGEALADRSGVSVALSGDGARVAIGAFSNDGNGTGSGHVRVYQYDSVQGLWSQDGADIDGEAIGDQSGASVSLSMDGERVAIGALGNNGGGIFSGHVRVYQHTTGMGWSQLGQDINGQGTNEFTGESVSLSHDGNRVATGGVGANGSWELLTSTGAARAYQFVGGAWMQIGNDMDGEAAYDQFGQHVSLSNDGERLAVGAYANSDNGYGAGHVRVFELDQATRIAGINPWEQLSVRPNPTQGRVIIDLGQRVDSVTATLSTSNGQVLGVFSARFTDQLEFTIQGAAGVYFVELKALPDKRVMVRLMKE